MKKDLKSINLDEKWLCDVLKEQGLSPSNVLLATLGTDGRLFVSKK